MNITRSMIENMTNNNDIKWCLDPNTLYNYFKENKDDLTDRMDIVCKSQFDDYDTAWQLCVTADFSDPDTMLLSLETPDVIVDSESVSCQETVIANIESLLSKL